MENTSIKRIFVYANMLLISLMCWYIVAELILTMIWQKLWHLYYLKGGYNGKI